MRGRSSITTLIGCRRFPVISINGSAAVKSGSCCCGLHLRHLLLLHPYGAAGLVFVFFPALVIISAEDSTACFNHAPRFTDGDCANRPVGAAVFIIAPPIRWAGTASNF